MHGSVLPLIAGVEIIEPTAIKFFLFIHRLTLLTQMHHLARLRIVSGEKWWKEKVGQFAKKNISEFRVCNHGRSFCLKTTNDFLYFC